MNFHQVANKMLIHLYITINKWMKKKLEQIYFQQDAIFPFVKSFKKLNWVYESKLIGFVFCLSVIKKGKSVYFCRKGS